MPQSRNVTVRETATIPEHTAEAAAASHNKVRHLTAHEETIKTEEHARNTDHSTTLHHGKAAALEAEKTK